MFEEYDWVDGILFISFSYAHITDWELADLERFFIQCKKRYIYEIINVDISKYFSDIIEKKIGIAYKY